MSLQVNAIFFVAVIQIALKVIVKHFLIFFQTIQMHSLWPPSISKLFSNYNNLSIHLFHIFRKTLLCNETDFTRHINIPSSKFTWGGLVKTQFCVQWKNSLFFFPSLYFSFHHTKQLLFHFYFLSFLFLFFSFFHFSFILPLPFSLSPSDPSLGYKYSDLASEGELSESDVDAQLDAVSSSSLSSLSTIPDINDATYGNNDSGYRVCGNIKMERWRGRGGWMVRIYIYIYCYT